ncbi:GntR family histidine utilization transcriptional repressor [Pseudomonas duriflava]|uniref:Histidine utilization repressor n=1 Tax=Pseudomonas duriflava TaxID=459528 RepID=A0A562QFR0_9PSED|nr:histidine utilization repressor [Pseudomonas duriflava]TWI55597.1 GntR family histidine utilization transcriptional repressor [Pseudomonas duriflava]
MSDKNAPQALYRKAKSFVESKLLSGEWKPGDLIPSENRLVTELGMSRMTVNRALRELTAEGQLIRLSGVGTFVADRKPQSNLLMIANIADEIAARGHRYSCEILEASREAASMPIAAALQLPTGSSVFHIVCVHCEEGTPVQLEDRYINPAMAPDFLQQRFDEHLQPSQYLLQHVPVDEMEHIVDATLPTPDECKALDIDATEPCLVLMRRTWVARQAVTYVRFLHPSSRYRLGSRFPVNGGNHAR